MPRWRFDLDDAKTVADKGCQELLDDATAERRKSSPVCEGRPPQNRNFASCKFFERPTILPAGAN